MTFWEEELAHLCFENSNWRREENISPILCQCVVYGEEQAGKISRLGRHSLLPTSSLPKIENCQTLAQPPCLATCWVPGLPMEMPFYLKGILSFPLWPSPALRHFATHWPSLLLLRGLHPNEKFLWRMGFLEWGWFLLLQPLGTFPGGTGQINLLKNHSIFLSGEQTHLPMAGGKGMHTRLTHHGF